jgi:hypothetical protein
LLREIGVPGAMTNYPTLWHFFGAYLHEDSRDDYADEWVAVEGLIAHGPPEEAQRFQNEIAALLSDHASEEEVGKSVLDELGSYYLVDAAGRNYRDWLKAPSPRTSKAIGHPQAS